MSSDCSASPPSDSTDHTTHAAQPVKRKATVARLDGAGAGAGAGTGRSVKRRASKACQSCRARKVRCNVTEYGGNAPCTNCRLDEVECIVSESRRKRKWGKDDETSSLPHAQLAMPAPADALDALDALPMVSSGLPRRGDEHVPHTIYQTHGPRLMLQDLKRRLSISTQASHGAMSVLGYNSMPPDNRQPHLARIPERLPSTTPAALPPFIKPIPSRIGPDEVSYLEKKGALSIPSPKLRGELLRCYIDFVYPYMPMLDLNDFIMTMERGDGSQGTISLILFQAIMFAGSTFADMRYLRLAGYTCRKEARRDLFQKTRLLYDFDYESDRVSLIQALLLLAFYYETPDDQKDTWHWMGVATSVAHTIGLHRNPEKSNMDPKRQKLWKRIWWSAYIRDRLIALGMRRPTRIKTEDYDMPLLTLDDFDFTPLPESVTCLPADCLYVRDVTKQRELAIMCIEKVKLCVCISHVLSKQYCLLNSSINNNQSANDRTTMMLLPKKLDPETCEVQSCDEELQKWINSLPEEAKYTGIPSGNSCVDLHRSLLHMIYYTTLSALHRPQVLPSSPSSTTHPKNGPETELVEVSRRAVRQAANAITNIAQMLDTNDLVKYLPTSGVTVLLPAIIIHLLDIKSPEEDIRRSSLRGFYHCMQVMGRLRDLYPAADYSTAFLEAAVRKAGILVPPVSGNANPFAKEHPITSVEDLVEAGRRLGVGHNGLNTARTLTPPPENTISDAGNTTLNLSTLQSADTPHVTDEEVARRLETFLASTPPDTDHMDDVLDSYQKTSLDASTDLFSLNGPGLNEFDEGDFDNLLNLDAVGEAYTFDNGGAMALQGESSGFAMDMDWMKSIA